MIGNFISVILWGLIGSLSPLVLYHFNLKKERFFNLQSKWELLLQYIYEYQWMLFIVDNSKADLNMISLETDKDIDKINATFKEHERLASTQQQLREKIWTLIVIYFPEIKLDFTQYTTIEIIHKPDMELNTETMQSRETQLTVIADKLIAIINNERQISIFWKI